ncbi:MAG: hypothetical protein AB7I30_16540, partial [Isosphaeraceae bacterium]
MSVLNLLTRGILGTRSTETRSPGPNDRSVRSRKRRIEVENLERRELLSGNVTASVVDGDLVITGDSASNWIQVRQVSEKKFKITGISTTINGRSSQTFTVADDIRMNMKGGDDTVDVRGSGSSAAPGASRYLKIFGDLDINTGSGHDTVIVKDVLVTDDVVIETGRGRDSVLLQTTYADDDVTVKKSNEDSGDFNVVSLYDVWTDRNQNGGGTLTIDLLSGADNVSLYGVFAEEMQIRTRGGDDTLSMVLTR